MKSIYIETTIPSLATSKPSRNTIIAGKQASTILFWEEERQNYELYVSQYVIDECSLGDEIAAKRRLEFIKNIPIIPKSEQLSSLAIMYQKLLAIPDKAKIDCYHLAACVLTETDYLLSWNCTHLGIHTYIKVHAYNESNNLFTPILLTPEALLSVNDSEEN
jgi:hypothetical protein